MRIPLLLAIVLTATACSTTADLPDALMSTTGTSPDAAMETLDIPAELADSDTAMVVVGDRTLLLAIADSPALRARGLMGVTDLGNLDGMLFYWRHEADGGFWMKDTLIPLDIVWFLEDGSYAGRASMVPCTDDPCPTYSPEGDPDYRYAIEARPGALDWIDASTRIIYSD
ncbi:MAG TPA: DUF192 domain-containing protein [Acidimicrobiia bacterium]|nr:DUF192 domain-containing protein [Acidimicrobiia bacterium]